MDGSNGVLPCVDNRNKLMTARRIGVFAGAILLSLAAAFRLAAAEYKGTVRANGLPVPGAAVTVAQGDRKILTTSDDQGRFTFADLPEGSWTLTVEMLGFGKVNRPFDASAAPPAIDLKLLSQAE